MEETRIHEGELQYIPINELHPHPDNPRKNLGDLTELADSIREKGVMQNLTIVPREAGGYTVIIGHRRMAASKQAGLKELPCIVTDMTPEEQVATMLLENMQRSDLTAYEQAQGFQMMMDFGEDVDSIARKTGFSRTTVTRRLKMAELDQEVLQEVSSRQINLGDFDKLAQIEDLDERNILLEDIGTNNFEQKLTEQLRKQEIAKAMPAVKAELRRIGAHKIERSQTYSGKYQGIGSIYIHKWDGQPLVSSQETRQLYYTIEENYGSLTLYVEREKAPPVKRSQEEIDREKRIEAARTELDALSATAYTMRKNFVDGLMMGKRNESAMLSGFVMQAATQCVSYFSGYVRWQGLAERLGIDLGNTVLDDKARQNLLDAVESNMDKTVPTLIYMAFGDRDTLTYYSGYKREYPTWEKNYQLDSLYKWLVSVGYEMSDDEKALQDGTHRLLQEDEE